MRFERAHRHSLTEDRVEAAERIAHHDEPGREARELLVVATLIRGDAMRDDLAERLRRHERIVKIGLGSDFANRKNPASSLGGTSPCALNSVTSQRFPSMGKI